MKNRTEQNRTEQNHYCLLTNNLNFYISQFFKAFNFLSVRFRFAKNQFAILITRGFNPLRLFAIAHNGLPTGTQKRKPVVICKLELQKFNIKLVKTFLTSITFDSLSRKIKNPCLVINKFINRRIFV